MEGESSDINPLLKCDRSQGIIYTHLEQNQFYKCYFLSTKSIKPVLNKEMPISI